MKKQQVINETIMQAPLNDLISERYGDYAKYIIQERALPDARDGLKPVQRRILYAMYRDHNTADKPFRKSAKTVGNVIGNYHPHGDSSVYEAMVHMSQSWKFNHPLVEMHGNNGSIDNDPAAAMRYTEARLAAITHELLEDIDKGTVSWTPNFDDTENEPTVLPAKFPNLLINGSSGIASGYATNIPPHNLNEIVEGTVYRINHPDCSLEDLMQYIKGPDFPTRGIVQGYEGIMEAFRTGKGRIVIRAQALIETDKRGQHIIVTEIPYEVVKSDIVRKIDEIRLNNAINGITDCRDESDRNGLKIVIDVHKDADAALILNYLYKNTSLQVYYNYNMIAIVNNRPMLLGLREALDAYIEFMKDFVLKRSKFEFRKRIDRCEVLEGLIKAVSVMDEVIAIIRASKDKADAKRNLIARFQFSEPQAEAIVVLRLHQLTNTDILELRSEYEKLVNEMKELNDIINNRAKLAKVLCDELRNTAKQYGHERYTQIEREVENIVIDRMSMIPNERVVVSLSRDGYIKRVSMKSYNASESELTGLKNEDELIGVSEADSYDTLLIFTESGEYVQIPVYQLEEFKWKEIGKHISNYVKVNNNEKFIGCFVIRDFDSYCWVVTGSRSGMIKKTALSEFKLQRASRSSTAMLLSDDDVMISAAIGYQGDSVYLVSRNGYSMYFSLDEVNQIGARAKGIIGMRLAADDALADMTLITRNDSEMVYLTAKGNSKRLKINDIPVTKRATRGVLIAKRNKTNPAVVRYCVAGSLNDDLNLICESEPSHLKFKDISLMDAESRFSVSTIARSYYHCPGIREVRIVDYPAEEQHKSDYEEIRLEV
ncbi:MAG: DNA topoisomerase IV subunit A [Erysipelotrichaceae bacterium]|nr:DNA topoisomerase IV subunit A [Erysipelotrichaceae bacterium]